MKAKTIFVCNECGYESAKWMGKCPAFILSLLYKTLALYFFSLVFVQ